MKTPRRAAGFTLVELLVVTGLMASLLTLVVAGLRPTPDAQVRQAAALLRPAVMKTQASALANPNGSALILKAETDTLAAGLVYGAVQHPIRCQLISGMLSNVYATGSTSVTVGNFLNAANARDGWRIRFGTGNTFGEWFGFTLLDQSGTSATTFLTPSGVQTTYNSVLPPSGPVVNCEISRYPQETTDVASFPPRTVAIDLRYSGLGDEPDPAPPRALAALNAIGDIALLFSRSGSLESIMPMPISWPSTSTQPVQPTAPLYLLLATREDIAANRSLLTNRSIWIAIAPDTGAVTSGKNVAQPTAPPIPTADWDSYALAYRTYFQQARANARPLGYTSSY